MASPGSKFEESMPNTRTQTTMHLSLTSCNLLLQTYICAAKLATWGVGPAQRSCFFLFFSSYTCNLLARTYICTAKLATWGVGPDVSMNAILLFSARYAQSGGPMSKYNGKFMFAHLLVSLSLPTMLERVM